MIMCWQGFEALGVGNLIILGKSQNQEPLIPGRWPNNGRICISACVCVRACMCVCVQWREVIVSNLPGFEGHHL